MTADSEEDLLAPQKKRKRILSIDQSSSDDEEPNATNTRGSCGKVRDDIQQQDKHESADFGGTTTDVENNTNIMLTGATDYLDDTVDFNAHRTPDDEAVRAAISSFGEEMIEVHGRDKKRSSWKKGTHTYT